MLDEVSAELALSLKHLIDGSGDLAEMNFDK
jgi:hypothetical protein